MNFDPPEPKEEDHLAASLLATLAKHDPQEAYRKLVPICSAARLWAEQQEKK